MAGYVLGKWERELGLLRMSKKAPIVFTISLKWGVSIFDSSGLGPRLSSGCALHLSVAEGHC